jgi:hypothetical protein
MEGVDRNGATAGQLVAGQRDTRRGRMGAHETAIVNQIRVAMERISFSPENPLHV